MPRKDDILAAFIRGCRERELILPGDRVLAAVSGGPDSLALLDLLLRWRESGGEFGLAAAHFNHQLRPEAEGEQRLVEEFSRGRGVECHCGRGDVAGWAKAHRTSVHAAARELRYKFLTETALRLHPQAGEASREPLVATGHQRDDQMETVLWRLLSGAGLGGLAGIRRREEWRAAAPVTVIRPLLDFRRAELERYCRARSLPFVTDRSNLDLRYPRVRIRRKLAPLLARQFGGEALEAVARTAELAAASADFIAEAIDSAREATVISRSPTEIRLDYDRFISYYDMLRTGMLQSAWQRLAKPGSRLGRERLVNADRHITTRRSGRLELGGGVCLYGSGGAIIMWRRIPWRDELSLTAGGTVEIPGFGGITARIADPAACPLPPPAGAQYCDYKELGPGPYFIRPAQSGDRMTPLGASQRCRVTDLLRDAGVPPHRRRYPVIVAGGEIAVIPGLRVAERVKLTPATRQAVIFHADWTI